MSTIEVSEARSRYPGEFFFGLSLRPLQVLDRLAREHGEVCRFSVGSELVYLLNHPELVQRVLTGPPDRFHKGRALHRARRFLGQSLLTSEGELHRKHRRLMQPAFHRKRIEGYTRCMAELSHQLSRRLQHEEETDLHAVMMELTLEIVTRTLLGTSVRDRSARVRDCLEETLGKFSLLLMPFGELLENLPLPPFLRLRRAQRDLDAIVRDIIREHRDGRGDPEDLLCLLLEARDEEGEALSDEQLRDEVLTIFLAGHETTANALSFTFYLLSRHPEVETKLHRELDSLLGHRPPNTGDLPGLIYTRQVVEEAMRLYPPAWMVARRTLDELELGGFRVPAHSIMVMSQWLLHRDARWWPEPERFCPDRFRPDQKRERPKFAYFPFGAGARMCIGDSFAMSEATLVVATLAREWTFENLQPEPLDLMAGITLRPRHGLWMLARRRS
ncbi:MAG: cytochrome P450 [Armatimonadetes bacterium]|nr:cytochrome P450 [Armatimonadota bacterium]